MNTEREVEIAVASCVATVGHLGDRSPVARAVALAQLHAAAVRVGGFGLGYPEVRRRVLRPIQAELLALYGLAEGARLNREFLTAFEA